MEFNGRIQRVLPTTSGKSANGNDWQRQDFVFEYFEHDTDRYSDKVLLSVMNERIKEYDLHEGDEVRIGFGHSVREYQGRVFNDARLYHFSKIKSFNSTEQVQAENTEVPHTQQSEPDKGKADDLPF